MNHNQTPVDSIVIPSRFVDLCSSWYNGMGDLLYAVSSTGNLTIGNRRPLGCDTDEKWYLTLWSGLASDVGYAVRCAKRGDEKRHDYDADILTDYSALVEFEEYVDGIVERLSTEYSLNDWIEG